MSEENGAIHKFINAVRQGDIEKLKELISSYGLPDSQDWPKGYILLRFATESKHIEIVKLLLKNGSEVNNKCGKSCTTPLHFAVKNNDIDIVRILVEKGADVNADDMNGITPFDIAVRENRLKIAEYLLNHGGWVNFLPDSNPRKGFTPLHIATEIGSEQLVELLLNNNAHVDAKDENGLTPLHIAIRYVRSEIVERLLIHGASVDSTYTSIEKKGYTLLHFAAETGNDEIINSLLSRGLNVDAKTENDSTPLHIAIEYRNVTAVRLFLKHGADVNAKTKDDRMPLNLAVSTGCSSLVETILNHGPDTRDECNESALGSAMSKCGSEFKKIVELLLKYGFDIKSEYITNGSLLNSAVENGHEKIVEIFLEHGTDANSLVSTTSKKKSLLHIASNKGHGPIVELLIDYGADVNAKDGDGYSPICYAIQSGNLETVELLLNNGTDVEDNSEPLLLAIRHKKTGIVKTLLKYNAGMNGRDKQGATAVHLTVSIEGNEEILKLILDRGFDVNARGRNGETALHIAVKNQLIAMVNILLEYDADVNCTDEKGEAALHIAVKNGYVDIVKILIEYGSDINITNKENHTAIDLVSDDKRSLYDENIEFDSNNDYKYLWNVSYKSDDSHYPEKIIEILLCHVVKLNCANLYVNDKNLSMIKTKMTVLLFYTIKCEEEITIMKRKNIIDNLSFYDILTNDLRKLEIYLRNENVETVLSSDYCEINFPIYSKMIDHRFREGRKRIDLLERSSIFFHVLPTSLPVLPSECATEILNYLNERDLKFMTIASEATNE